MRADTAILAWVSQKTLEALTKMAGRPWREIRRGSAINDLWLAQQLGAFGIQSRTMRIGDSVGSIIWKIFRMRLGGIWRRQREGSRVCRFSHEG